MGIHGGRQGGPRTRRCRLHEWRIYRVACNIFVNDNEASDDPAFEKCGPRREMIGFELLVYGMIEEIARNFVRKT